MFHHLTLALTLPLVASSPPTVEPKEAPEPVAEASNVGRSVILQLTLEGAPSGFDVSLGRALSDHEIRVADSSHDGSLEVTIRPWSGGGVEGFGYDLDLSRDGVRVGDVFSQVCVGCDVGDLATEIAAHVADMTEALPPAEEQPPAQPPAVARAPAPTLPPPKPKPPRGSLARPFLATGIPSLALGCTLVGVGLALIAKGRVIDPATGDLEILEGVDYRPPGVALAISGGIAIGVGAVLTGVGGDQHRRERSRQAWSRVPRLAFRPPASSGARRPSTVTGSGSR